MKYLPDSFLFFQLPPSQFTTQMTALHIAVRFKSSKPVVNVLLEAGSDPNARDDLQKSPLHWAAQCNPQCVGKLLQHNAEVNLLDKFNRSPLLFAAKYKNRDAVIALAKAGGDPRLGVNPLTFPYIDNDIKEIIKRICK